MSAAWTAFVCIQDVVQCHCWLTRPTSDGCVSILRVLGEPGGASPWVSPSLSLTGWVQTHSAQRLTSCAREPPAPDLLSWTYLHGPPGKHAWTCSAGPSPPPGHRGVQSTSCRVRCPKLNTSVTMMGCLAMLWMMVGGQCTRKP